MHIVHDQYLAIITWICKYFLVAGHAGIKTNLTCGGALAKCFAIMQLCRLPVQELQVLMFSAMILKVVQRKEIMKSIDIRNVHIH